MVEQAQSLKRRGLIAAAAALAVGVAMKEGAEPVGAIPVEYMRLNAPSSVGTADTVVTASGLALDNGVTFTARGSSTPAGSGGNTRFVGIAGIGSDGGDGVRGTGGDAVIVGGVPFLAGTGIAGTGGASVGGRSGMGVSGISASGTGVYGISTTGSGVVGTSSTGNGVVGGTDTNTASIAGGFFYTTANGGSAMIAQCFNSGSGAAAFVGAAAAGNYAAFLTGQVQIVGNLAISGTFVATNTKSAAIKSADGTHRLVYCTESPDAWLEDVGATKLVGGKADVKIDADFAAIVKTDAYHVFTSPDGDCKGLYITNKTATGFTVREMQGGTSSLVFSYRVMVKRSDVKAERLARYDLPNARLLPDKVPDVPRVVPPRA